MQENPKQPKKENEDKYSGLNKYIKYTGIAFQMLIIILIFVWAGKKLDQKFNDDENLFIIIFSILGVFISLYVSLKDFIHFRK